MNLLLNAKGRHLDSNKFVVALNDVDSHLAFLFVVGQCAVMHTTHIAAVRLAIMQNLEW